MCARGYGGFWSSVRFTVPMERGRPLPFWRLLGLLVALLCLPLSLPALAVDADLSPQAQARQYLQEIAAAARENDHQTLVTLCESMLKLEGVRMDDSIRFYYGRSLMELGRHKDAEREIALFLKSGNNDEELLDQALAMRTALKPKIVLEECRAGFRHRPVFRKKDKLTYVAMKGDDVWPSVKDLKAAAESTELTEKEKGELHYFLGQRIFYGTMESVGNMSAKDADEALKKALAAFRISSDLGNNNGKFMYGLLLMEKKFSGAEHSIDKGRELIRSAEARGSALAKEYLKMNPEKR